MALLRRREKPPAPAGLAPEERVVSWGDTESGLAVIATSLGLWWPDADGPRRIPWQRIDKAVWRDGVLSVVEADLVEDFLLVDRAPVAALLVTPRDLPPTVRKRVEANIVRTELVTVPGGAVRFVGRREPGRDGTLWLARLEPGTPDTELVRTSIRARLARLGAAAPS